MMVLKSTAYVVTELLLGGDWVQEMGGKLITKPLARPGNIEWKWGSKPASVSSQRHASNMYGVSGWCFLCSRALASSMIGGTAARTDMEMGVFLFASFVSLPLGTD